MVLKKSPTPLITIHEPKYHTTDVDLSDHYPISVHFSDLNIISYNLQFMPMLIGVKGKNNLNDLKNAVVAISDFLINNDADICCVQELFDNTANELLTSSLAAAGYIASPRLEPSIIPFTSGGVRTFIKKEYANHLVSYNYYYRNSIDYFFGADAIAHKGVVHTPLLKNGIRYHIFNTHLQAYYPTREHYTEITLAQCMELKNFVQQQVLKGIIKADEQVILCGDFNIPVPNNEQENTFLFTKMKKILGPQFAFVNYNLNASGPQHTFSKRNIYNKRKRGASDLDINTDAVLLFHPILAEQAQLDNELSVIYGDIQRAIASYVRHKATVFSWWRLAKDNRCELTQFNKKLSLLMAQAEELKIQNINPIDNSMWYSKALILSKGPGWAEKLLVMESTPARLAKDIFLPESNFTIEQARDLYQELIVKLKQIHLDVHSDYIYFGEPYQRAYIASLNLNRILEREGRKFFANPSAQSFYHFKCKIMMEVNSASMEFEAYPYTWSQLNPIIKGVLGVLALLTVLPFLYIITMSSEGYKQTFFRNPTPSFVEIKDDLERPYNLS